MKYINERGLKLTPSEVEQRMRKQGIHNYVIADALSEFVKAKKVRKSLNAKDKSHRRMWLEFLSPLKYEIKNLKVMLQYESTPERTLALSEYLALLQELLGVFEVRARNEGKTPAQLAKTERHHNDGNHWTDWIPNSKKIEMTALFDAIPARVKVKVPFERKLPKALHETLKARLVARTDKELDLARHKLNIQRLAADDPEREEQLATTVERIQQALNWALELGDNEAVPTTWSGFYKSNALMEAFK